MLGLWAIRYKLWFVGFDESLVFSWLTVQSLASRYEYIEHNNTCQTSSRAVIISISVETEPISCNRAVLG